MRLLTAAFLIWFSINCYTMGNIHNGSIVTQHTQLTTHTLANKFPEFPIKKYFTEFHQSLQNIHHCKAPHIDLSGIFFKKTEFRGKKCNVQLFLDVTLKQLGYYNNLLKVLYPQHSFW